MPDLTKPRLVIADFPKANLPLLMPSEAFSLTECKAVFHPLMCSGSTGTGGSQLISTPDCGSWITDRSRRLSGFEP